MPEYRVSRTTNVIAKDPEAAASAAIAAWARHGTVPSVFAVAQRLQGGKPWFGVTNHVDLDPDDLQNPMFWPGLVQGHPDIDWRAVKRAVDGATSLCAGCGSCIFGTPGEPPDYYRHGSAV